MSHDPIDVEELSAAVAARMPHLSDEEVAVALSPEPVLTYCATAPMPGAV